MNFDDLPSLEKIEKVTFFKIDEFTSDLVCCDIVFSDDNGLQIIHLNEDRDDLARVDCYFASVEGYDKNWRENVILPPFEECEYVAFKR